MIEPARKSAFNLFGIRALVDEARLSGRHASFVSLARTA
jgi:hypothetical protein